MASVNKSLAPADLKIESLSLVSLIPISSSIFIAESPASPVSDKPPMNFCKAPVASFSNACLNSAVVIPATDAKSSNSPLPVSTASCILTISLENDVPPAAASSPTELNEVANATMSLWLIPICVPAAPRFIDISTMSFSVVAKLFPNSTITEPNLSKSSWLICVTLANLANDEAASSALMFVATPISVIVFVKLNMFSVLIPSCPAASATAPSSVVVTPVSFDKPFSPSFIASSCSGVMSSDIVFWTPVQAESKSIVDLNIPANAPVATAEAGRNFLPTSSTFLPVSFNCSPVAIIFAFSSSYEPPTPFSAFS